MVSDILSVILPAIYKFTHEGGDTTWIVVALTPIAVAQILRLGRRLVRGEAVTLAAWVLLPAIIAVVGGLGGVLRLEDLRNALGMCSANYPGGLAANGIANAHNPPILALTLVSGLYAWSAACAARAAGPLAQPDRLLRVATLVLALALALYCWRLDLGTLALLASGLLALMGAWTPRSTGSISATGLRACATAGLVRALGVIAAWTASAFALDRRRLLARVAFDLQESWRPFGKNDAHSPLQALPIPPSWFELAVPATVSCLLATAIAARVLAPFVYRCDQRTRRDLMACATLVTLAAVLLVAASWPGAYLDEFLGRLLVLPTPQASGATFDDSHGELDAPPVAELPV